MGQAKITAVGPGSGQYSIEIVKDPGKSVARLAAIAKRLTALAALITQAEAVMAAAESALNTAEAALNMAISQSKPGGKPAPVVAVPHWANTGNGTVTDCEVGAETNIGNYDISCQESIASPQWARFWLRGTVSEYLGEAYTGTPFSCSEMSFRLNNGSVPFETGDSFDIDITEVNINPNVDLLVAQKAVVEAIKALSLARLKLSGLIHEQFTLQQEQSRLTAAMAIENRTGIWCVDKTTTLAVNTIVGTIELAGEETPMLITAGGAVAKSLGKLQHVGVSSPSACFVNMARKPAWKKWKPISRQGTIITMYYDTGRCDVAIEGGSDINQPGEEYKVLQAAVSGWTDFVGRNPDFPLASSGDSQITSTQALLADLASVNAEVNSRNNYKKDTETYAKLEYWSIMQPGGRGDCEDYALTKAQLLLDKGYPASAIHIEVGTFKNGEGHAWLVVQTSAGDIALDINYAQPIPAEQTGYYNRKRQYGMTWKTLGVLLRNVAFDYMSGLDEAVFRENDIVVVEFTGQDWTKPKVIGFVSNPVSTQKLLYFGPSSSPFTGYTRSDLTRVWHYHSSVPVGRINPLSCPVITQLILACPDRKLTDAELAAISAFAGRGGKVSIFNGDNMAATNEVLNQLGSKLYIVPTTPVADSGVFFVCGVYRDEWGDDQYWNLPGEIRGFITVRREHWNEAYLKDSEGFGLKYNSITSMAYSSHLIMGIDAAPKWPSVYCAELYIDLDAYLTAPPSPPTWTMHWDMQVWNTSPARDMYPAGFLPGPAPYNLSMTGLRDWLATNAGKLPFGKIALYGTTISQYPGYFGWILDYTTVNSRTNFEHFCSMMAYAEGETITLMAFKPTWLTELPGVPAATVDYNCRLVAFLDWVHSGARAMMALFGHGYSFGNYPGYWPHHVLTGEGMGEFVMPIQQ